MNKETDIEIVTKKFAQIKMAIEMHLRNYRVVGQIESRRPQPGQKFAPEAIYGGWRNNGPWPKGWSSATKRAVLGMSRRGGCKSWEWRFM